MTTNRATIDTLRTLAFGSISGTYAKVGTVTSYPTRIICFTNTTDADVIFSMDATNDQIIVAAGGFKLFDITTNHRPHNVDDFCISSFTQWWVKQASTGPTKGSVYIEIVFAQP